MQGIPQIGPGQSPTPLPAQGTVAISLALGEVVRGEVLNILPDAISMRVKKEILLAQSDIPLIKGESYLFRVESLMGNTGSLKVLQALKNDETPSAEPMRNRLETLKGETLSSDQILSFKKILEHIPEAILERLPALLALKKIFKNMTDLTPDSLKEAIDASGGFFENKMRATVLKRMEAEGALPGEEGDVAQIIQNDLKGNLFKLKQALLAEESLEILKESGVKVAELSQAVDKLLTHIEQQQLTSKWNAGFQTFIPFIWEGLKDGKMTFKESYHPREGETEHSCVIALDLEKAGKLVTHVRLFSDDRLHLRFVSESPQLTTALEASRPMLEKQLSNIGITCNSLVITREEAVDFENTVSSFGLDIEV